MASVIEYSRDEGLTEQQYATLIIELGACLELFTKIQR
jgi:hypothetical protein